MMTMETSQSVRRGVVVVLAAAALGPIAALASEDYTRYSNEELVKLRSQAQSMGEEERLRYREEMQKRVQKMTPEERERLGIGDRGQEAQNSQKRERTRTNEDNDRGQGEMQRERQRSEAQAGNYGQGYESRQPGGRSQRGGMGGAGMGRSRGGR
jgi:hypothetical protein